MWESQIDHFVNEDAHTLVLFGLTKNVKGGESVATEPPAYTLEFEGGHELAFICRCTDPEPVIEEIEKRGEHPYLAFVSYEIASMRAFGVAERPKPGLIINNVTGPR